ncbi:MAG: hypothetical protein JNL32_11090, partial [Candidatus Kapabacteria bacterium]|nr:hypothetical protein [Candidatus Kapabacteria bacterium]
MYAARSGTQWRVYRGEEEIAGVFNNITEAACNLSGTACAVLASQGIGMVAILFGEEFNQPLVSRVFDRLDGLALHPSQAIYGCRAMMNGVWLLVMNGAQYGSGQLNNGRPYFTHDGAELLHFGCDTDCGLSINGKRTLLNMNLNPEIQYARKPKSETFAFTTTTSLVFRKVEKNDLWVSYMCDETSLPRYNWRTDSYEALGRINQRLYFLSCKAF